MSAFDDALREYTAAQANLARAQRRLWWALSFLCVSLLFLLAVLVWRLVA